ncbi:MULTISPECIES: zinc-ribbon domain-containing protein [Dehalococcoides]|jgi:hypothetical protein|uniref:Uncharacterized protein n=2 Tax=Dehalococcoides mccartyi TaxID=61435 RepID=A0A142V899_9CHLR|nr:MULTISPECIES: zinc-ribbon domain-containing protein [Dehalococcoides]AGG05861.1 hypothetical protein dcmb_230 [Dehalococcoides mccartyi DCMB5]AGG07262.1 hypothetical protein btf_153 [Dehalococcoides mccartyi BTF08]AII60411.1 hypothetical protein X794_00920 [Dehalococcoides mccartyi CG5]AMU86053.1 hypothetical protein Dm11a5_0222 [Dehalococcoides mccartyi]AOV98861.1 hypothetical protein DCWBC2_0188 [Dehalococcoides mccartyi]
MPKIGPIEIIIIIILIMIPVGLIWGLIYLFNKLNKKKITGRNMPLDIIEINKGVQYCTRCGQKLEANIQFCPVCGTEKLHAPKIP